MAIHRILIPDLQTDPNDLLTITGEEAHHALRSKRLGLGDPLQILNGRGSVLDASIEHIEKIGKGDWIIAAKVIQNHQVSPISPRLQVLTGVPKGPRLENLIEGLSQAGAGAWGPLKSARSVVHPRDGKLNRLNRTASESAKQCGRAWVLQIQRETTFDQALQPADGTKLVLADASGDQYQPVNASEIRLLIGPEGGWSKHELDTARTAGAHIASFGPHAMRIETAAAIATALILDKERNLSGTT